MKIADAQPAHYLKILELNEGAIPHVNSISRETLENLAQQSKYFLVALDENEHVSGFLLTLDENADYQSLNYQYFLKHFNRFLYVDRIVVQDSCQRQGIGRKLYETVKTKAMGTFPVCTCEVNLHPPNPHSLRFHERCGFAGVDQQETENGNKRVLLLVQPLTISDNS
ncbi:MAG: GNAT family N-acetyltransferase [Planctomycetota bacterium]|nr:GNAT family N-acetyltransferase [Planctomycetota bacterium]